MWKLAQCAIMLRWSNCKASSATKFPTSHGRSRCIATTATTCRRASALAYIAARLDAEGPVQPAPVRDASGVGRNVVIEVLEYFDAQGYTRREGDLRRVVGQAASD